jgi:iron complex outermembrane receptor protein
VPKTVDNLSAELLDAMGIDDTIDLQNAVPGFSFKTNSVLGQPYLRGVGSDFISAGAESSVATFADGVYLPRAFDSIVDLFDIERVEVLKGPQAVHLGRNVVGGAVSIHNVAPGRDRAGYVDVHGGSYAERRVRAATNVPLPSETLALRIAASTAKHDGYTDNVYSGTDENGEDFYALRVKFAYEPSEALSLAFTTERHSEDSTRATGTKPLGIGSNGGIALGGYVPPEPREIAENILPFIDVDGVRHSVRVDWALGGYALLATTGYVATDVALALDLDSTDAAFASNHPTATSRAWMQELRLVSTGESAWSWTAGTFLLDERANQTLDVRLPQTSTRTVTDADVDTRSYALFGDGAYRFSERWRGRVGVRYTQDAREIDLVRTAFSPANPPQLTQMQHGRWSGTTPEVGIEFTPSASRLWYGSLARGYKAGGFNTSSIQAAFAPEDLLAYEVGLKTTLRSQRVRINAALFHYDYEDLQLNTPPTGAPVGTFPRVINAAKAIVRGADLELLIRPLGSAFTLSFGATLLDGEFDEFVSLDPNNPGVNPDRAGNRLPQAPEVSANVRGEYVWTLSRGTVALAGEYRRQSATYFNIYEDPALRQAGYGAVNASLQFESARGDWYASLVGRNLTDELYAQTLLRNDPLGGVKVLWAAPRTFGVTFGYRWR